MADYDVELLISAVCKRPALWDKSLDIYKDRNEVVKSWEEVCKVLNVDFATLSTTKQKNYEKEVIKKWKTLRSGYRKALERTKKAKRSGAPASKIKKYVFHDQMDFMRKVFDSKATEETVESENSSQESAEADAQDPILCSALPSTQETQAIKKKRPNETPKGKPDEFEAKLLRIIENPNRHLAFIQGLLPTLNTFTDDEVLEFQAGTLSLIQNIKRARSIRPYSAPPIFAEQNQAGGYSSCPQQIHQHRSVTAPQYSVEAHYDQPVTSPMTQMSDTTTPSPSSSILENAE